MRLVGSSIRALFLGGILILVGLAGLGLLAQGLAGNTVSKTFLSTPITPLDQLAKVAGTGKIVRAEARTLGQPALQTANHESLTFEELIVEHEERSGGGTDSSTRTVVDFAEFAPTAFAVGDGTTSVAVKTTSGKEIDSDFLPQIVAEPLGSDYSLGPKAKAVVVPDLAIDLATAGLKQRDATVRVRAIKQDVPVTLYGTVVMDGGKPAFEAPPDGKFFIVSPLPPEQIAKEAKRTGLIRAVIGGLLLVGALVMALYLLLAQRIGKAKRGAPARQIGSILNQ